MKKFWQAIKDVFRRYFISGLIVILPIIGTIWVLDFLVISVDRYARRFVPSGFYPEQLLGFDIPGLGFVVTICLVLLIGFLARLYVGHRILSLSEYLFSKIPLARNVYATIKQFLTTVMASGNRGFKRVVLVEFPRRGSWMIGLQTVSLEHDFHPGGEKLIGVFVTTTPNPTSGFLIFVPEKDVVELNMSIDQAFKAIISGGIVYDRVAGQTGES